MESFDVHQLERLRPVGRLERYSTMRHHLGLYNNVGVTAYYCNHSTLNHRQRVFNAVAAIIELHPILSAIPVDEGTKVAYFARLQSVDLESCIEFLKRRIPYSSGSSDSELDEIITAQHNKPFEVFNGTRPFWRLIILSNPDLETSFTASFIYHHALGDGLSGMAFHKAFLNSVSGTECAPLPSMIVPSFDGPLLPEMEKSHHLPLSFMTLMKGLYHDYFSNIADEVWSGGPVTLPLVSQFRSFSILPEALRRFAKACRRNSTTVTATIQVFVAIALFKLLPSRYTELICQVAISLRRWMPPLVTEDSIGCWVATVGETYRRQEFSWDEARRSRQTMIDFLSQNGKDTNVGLLRWLSDYKQHFMTKVGKKRATSFEVTNLGTWLSDKSAVLDGWKIGRMVFSQSATVVGGAVEICVCSGGDGSMTLGCAWQEGIIEKTLMNQVMGCVHDQIELVSSQEAESQ